MIGPLRALDFPPLLTGYAVAGDARAAAVQAAVEGIDPGAVFHGVREDVFDVAIVLAPEVPLGRAMSVAFAVTLGFNDALGALAPPEVAVHLDWPDAIRVNGALCGRLTAEASTTDARAEPDWLVLGLEVPVTARPGGAEEPGHRPDETCLAEEGCDIPVPDLTEAWARHMMNWLHIWLTEGFEPLHREVLAKLHARETGEVPAHGGAFVGLDEHGGLILRTEAGTRIVPLTEMLDQ